MAWRGGLQWRFAPTGRFGQQLARMRHNSTGAIFAKDSRTLAVARSNRDRHASDRQHPRRGARTAPFCVRSTFDGGPQHPPPVPRAQVINEIDWFNVDIELHSPIAHCCYIDVSVRVGC